MVRSYDLGNKPYSSAKENKGYVPDDVEDGGGSVTLSINNRQEKSNGASKDKGAGKLEEIDLGDQPDGEEKKKAEEKVPPATIRELFSFSTGLDWIFMSVGAIAALAHGASWPILTLTFGDMTDTFVNYGKNSTNGTSAFEDKMIEISLRYVYIGIGVGISTYLQMALWQLASERQTFKLRKAFFQALLRQNIGWFDKQQSGNLTTKLADDLERIREGIGDKISMALQFLSQFLSGFLMGFIKGWKMTLVIMSLTPLLAFFAGVLGKLHVNYSTQEQLSYAKAGGIAEEVLSGIRTVTSFNGHAQEIKRYIQALTKCMKMGIKKSFFTGLSIGLTLLVMFCAYGLGFWYGSTQVDEYQKSNMEEGYSPGDVITIFFSVMVGSFALGSASPHITAFLGAKGAGGTIFPILKAKPPIDSSDPGGKKPNSIQGRIEFKNLAFSYPSRPEAQILDGFNLSIEPGQTVALVGASGCGKSTIVNLVQRFYDPEEGSVQLDGVDIRELNVHWLRGNIGIVSQEPVLFGMSIAKNIMLGQPDISEEDIEKAARMANAHDFISALPEGYNTLVGERGAQLSGGQKQRVAIARALVRDPRIILLDEATSALDSESEGIVQAALDKAGVGRTTIIIAHRLSTIQNADVIYVMEDGNVVEQGKHHELMAKQGSYYKLVTLQMIAEEDELEQDETAADVAVLSPEHIVVGRKTSVNRRLSKQLSNPGTKRQRSESNEHPPEKKFTLFKKKVEEEEEKDVDVEKPGFLRVFKSNLTEWPFILFGCLGAMVNGLIFPGFAFFYSEIIKSFMKTGPDLLHDALLWSMMFVSLGGISFIANIVQQLSFGFSGERLTHRLRVQAFTNIVRQDISYFDDPKHSTGALVTRLATDATMIKLATGSYLATILQCIASLLAGLIIAFYYGWKLTLALLLGVPLIMLSGSINMKLLRMNQQRDSNLLEEAGKTASECMENIRTVQGLTREPHFYEDYSKSLLKPYKENMKQAHVYGASYCFSQSVVFFLYAAAFRFGAWLVIHDGMPTDLVFRVFMAITFTGMSIGQGSVMLPYYSKAQLAAGKIFKILDAIPGIDIYSKSGETKQSISGEIQVKDVTFRYPTRPDMEVLRGISLHVKPGQTAALVGMSGCGKSTVISLIQRFYNPNSGSILVEGLDVSEYNLKSLRSMISVVSQEPILFNTTIKENIVYGLENELSMAEIIQAARTSNAHDFISQLPDGYETNVGEKGTQLSGGQKQRIAIARALIRNPKILLLDEATSALDTESEKVVQEALDKAREGRTCIVIAHRLSTIQNSDVIFVIERGRVVESGSHQDLLAKRGAYSVLVGGQQFKKEDEGSYDDS